MNGITLEHVRFALSNVMEPDLGKDLITLDMVRDISINGNRISLVVELTTPACPLKDKMRDDCEKAIRHFVDKSAEVGVTFTSKTSASAKPDSQLEGIANIVAIASGKGGVGKSTVAVNLAVALASAGARVGLLDLDIYGPSIPTMMNAHDTPNITAQRKLIPPERFGVKCLSMGMMVSPDQAVIWRGPMVTKAVQQFFYDVAWGELDYLILDLPPGTGDIQLTIVQSIPLTGAVIVSTPQLVALADARKAIAMFRKVNVPVLGLIENMAYFQTPEVPDKKFYIFGKAGATGLADELDVPVLGEIPLEIPVREGADTGLPVCATTPGIGAAKALAEAAGLLVRQISVRNAQLPPTQKIAITRT